MLGRRGRSALRRLAGGWRIEQPPDAITSRAVERRGRWLSAFAVAAAVAIAVGAGLLSARNPAPGPAVSERPAPVDSTPAERPSATDDEAALPLTDAAPLPAAPRATIKAAASGAAAEAGDEEAVAGVRADTSPVALADSRPDWGVDMEWLPTLPGRGGREPGEPEIGGPVHDPLRAMRDHLGLGAFEDLPLSFAYEVGDGDSLGVIADRFGLTVASLLGSNRQIANANLLQVGEEITVPTRDGVLHEIAPGETLSSVIEYLDADYDETVALRANRIGDPNLIRAGQTVLFVGGVRPEFGQNFALFARIQGSLRLPVAYDRITDRFGVWRERYGRHHWGLDFSASHGTPVTAARQGTVSGVAWDQSYGNWVEIDHADGFKTRYAHLSAIHVVHGEWVVTGEQIGTVGSTGLSSGPHLHFELLLHGEKTDPEPYLVLR